MTKSFATVAIALGFVLPAFAGASTSVACDKASNHPVYSYDGSTVVGCISGSDWSRAEAEAAARANPKNVFAFATGASVTLKSGRVETCPWWFPAAGCVIPRELIVL